MPPRENDEIFLLETDGDPGHIGMDYSKLKARSEPAAPVVAVDVDEVKDSEPVATPSGLLQYILCMFVNFIVVSLGINWFLGFFGLALKPLADLDNQEESVLMFKEKKRKLEEIDMFSGVDGGQEKLTKRPKPEEVVVQEEDAAETEDEELSIKKSVGSKDKAKAIAEFQSRLWNMKPDFNFLDVEPKTEAKVQAKSDYKLMEEIEDDRKDVVKKAITPSESFDNVLNMSDDTSEISTGDDAIYVANGVEDIIDCLVEENDVSLGDATIGDPIYAQNEQCEERRDLNTDLETEPTGTPSPNEWQKVENGNVSETQNYTEEESVANGIDDEPAQADYPVLVKPDYAVQAKPDYQVQEKPDYALQEKPDYALQEKPDYALQEKPDYALQEKPDYALQEKPDYALQEKPDYALQEKPDYPLQEKPDYALQEKPDYQVQRKPDYRVIEKPVYQVLKTPEYPVKEKLGCPISGKLNYQALEKPISALLDSMEEKQDNHQLATKIDGSVSEELEQLTINQPFLEGQLEKSIGSIRQMTTVEDQTENEDAAIEDNDEYESLKMDSCKNTIELGEEKKVTEEGQGYEKSDEILTQLSTSKEQTEKENAAACDDARAANHGEEVCEESTLVDVEEKKSEVAEKEGRRGSVGSKGKGGGNKSGSKQKKKRRKIL